MSIRRLTVFCQTIKEGSGLTAQLAAVSLIPFMNKDQLEAMACHAQSSTVALAAVAKLVERAGQFDYVREVLLGKMPYIASVFWTPSLSLPALTARYQVRSDVQCLTMIAASAQSPIVRRSVCLDLLKVGSYWSLLYLCEHAENDLKEKAVVAFAQLERDTAVALVEAITKPKATAVQAGRAFALLAKFSPTSGDFGKIAISCQHVDVAGKALTMIEESIFDFSFEEIRKIAQESIHPEVRQRAQAHLDISVWITLPR